MSGYRLTGRADQDLIDIFFYGFETYGLLRAERYSDDLHRCFERLSRYPQLGRRSPAFGENTRRHEHANHVVIYEEREYGVLILALVHRSSLPSRVT